jgi:hypothetical protein
LLIKHPVSSIQSSPLEADQSGGFHLRIIALALTLFALSAAGAVVSFQKSAQLETQARWLMARADAHAAEYASSLYGALADQQLAMLDQRRNVLERAQFWQRIQKLLILVGAVAGIFAYLRYLLYRLRAPDRHRERDSTSASPVAPK